MRTTRQSASASARARSSAQGLLEYGLIIAIVAIAAIAGLLLYGPTVGSLLSSMGGSV